LKLNFTSKHDVDFLSILRPSVELSKDADVTEEVFSVEQLEQYATQLATELKVQTSPTSGHPLLPELDKNGSQLLQSYLSLAQAIRSKESVSPAAEWLVDNFHIVEDQIRGIKSDLPKNYYSELPKLISGKLSGFPRVYSVAVAFIAHTDSRIEVDTLKRFIAAFQKVEPLGIGELWAVAITLRIVLVERLNVLAHRVVMARQCRADADAFADEILDLAMQPHSSKDDLVDVIKAEMGQPVNFNRAFVVQLAQRLRDQDPDVWPMLSWLEEKLKENKTSTNEVVQLEHRRQSAEQVTIGNIITSMRLLQAVDWRLFFESTSLVDPILAKDPAGAYSQMEFMTRDAYRHAIERIAKGSRRSEIEIAKKTVDLSLESQDKFPEDEQRCHVGYYLVGAGVSDLEKIFSYRPTQRERFSRWVKGSPTAFYFCSVFFLTLSFIIPPYKYFFVSGGPPWGSLALGIFIVLSASEIAVNILNHYITFFAKPKLLPKIDLLTGIPQNAKTMVVIPTLFNKVSVVTELLDKLEVHYLANAESNIYFALLGDFVDADAQNLDSDPQLLDTAKKGIQTLNDRYGAGSDPIFFVFHRFRQWNPSEAKWMGWERKRGKLLEFNQLLRGSTETTYLPHEADPNLLKQINYVITLDSDTQLPRDAARRLIGTALHPLNRPIYSREMERVVSGYGILQPRVGVSLVSASNSRFAHIFSGNSGLDPYTTSVSDVYQDLFEEGSFTGKGLYHVDAFDMAVANRGPENAVLSHDLFEGSYARTALVTDIEVFDDYPSDFHTFAKRLHRWTRGDWQIARWLFPVVPDAAGKFVPNKLSLISKWKIFDNLRRSLLAPAMLLWLFLAWTFLPGSPVVWTLPILILIAFPIYTPLITGTFFYTKGLTFKEHVKGGWAETVAKIQQISLMTAFLPAIAYTQVDAICRTLYRQFVSKKNLLEWVTFTQVESTRKEALRLVEFVGPGPIFSVILAVAIKYSHSGAYAVAFPFLLAWFANPLISFWLSKKENTDWRDLKDAEVKTFRQYARRTWFFFEKFVGPEDHWLAPDNFQEEPTATVAHRTSPTNIGLQLLATASAYDLGYVGQLDFIESCERIFQTLEKLPKMRGHFFNWYDTQTLEPLRPQYISTVDSGNLAGHLLALKQTFAELIDQKIKIANGMVGLSDTLKILLIEAYKIGNFPNLSGVASADAFFELVQSSLRVSRDGTLERIAEKLEDAKDILDVLTNEVVGEAEKDAFLDSHEWLDLARKQTKSLLRDKKETDGFGANDRMMRLMDQCDLLALGMDFRFLFDENRKIFVIGYNVQEAQRDNSYYDLLASESRLASFIAIAKGDVHQEHWFRLGRQVTEIKSERALIAWTATMFEYLMPILVMRRYENTLLDQTYLTVVDRQKAYGTLHHVPWGVSESAYNARDLQLNYQYGPFGIPGLGLKRGLSDELVISSYSTFLAAMIDPQAALKNLKRLESLGMYSKYGFYEAIDYTPERLPKDKSYAIIKSAMAHHQGMSLVAMNNVINPFRMQIRFHSEPRVRATQLLLQEKIPRAVAISRPRAEEVHVDGPLLFSRGSKPRIYTDVSDGTPRTQLLSNGSYSVMITTAGSGYSKYKEIAVNRWREDWTRDPWGQFFYVRERGSNQVWSTGFQPTQAQSDTYKVTFAEDKVEIWREDGSATTHTEIVVAPEDNVELRRISLTNNSDDTMEYDVTSFMEVVLAKAADDHAHMAFSNLFVQTEFVPSTSALLATRRRRSAHENQVWGFHLIVVEGDSVGPIQFETDRNRFLGRGRNAAEPISVKDGHFLSGTVGSVLDPIFSLRQTVKVAAGETVRLMFVTGVAETREQAIQLTNKYHDTRIFSREASFAWTHSQVQLRHLNIEPLQAHLFQRLAARIIYSDSTLRPRSHVLTLNQKTQSALWPYGISGDLPIVLVRISNEKYIPTIRELLHGHEYLRMRGLRFDLVILNELGTSYIQSLHDELQRQVRMSGCQGYLDKPGGVFIRRKDQMPAEDVILMNTIARINLNTETGTLREQLERRTVDIEFPKRLTPRTRPHRYQRPTLVPPQLKFFNGLGGFSNDEKTYVITLTDIQSTPAPWINVIANQLDFGFTVSESGSGYTWSNNSRENRLTSWSNDAVCDPPSEIIYIRDEESGVYWTPTPLPVREAEPYVIKHSQGHTVFEHNSNGIDQKLTQFVPLDDTIKISRLLLKNVSPVRRSLSVTSFTEWVLGTQRNITAPTVITEYQSDTQTVYARNPYNNEFAHRIAFVHMTGTPESFTCDRKEFLGRNGSSSRPAAMERVGLSGRSGGGFDPCTAFQTKFDLAPGEERQIVILLGQSDKKETASELVQKYSQLKAVDAAFAAVNTGWDKINGAIEIKTPDASMNTLVNHWLLYQTLSCRIWGRSAFYQSGGAYGFRDQLQDVMALVFSDPKIMREQILRAVGRQFKQGDVQHWWHPPTGRGVRTRISDDLLWLPLVACYYVMATHDHALWDEVVPFIEAPELSPGQDDLYLQPSTSAEEVSIFEHCARAIDRSLKVGDHGLPLMGAGDWNDGMNRVGNEGKGESVWVGWFLANILGQVIPLCEKNGNTKRAETYRACLQSLKKSLEENAWDGDWYRRAYFDNGLPLGSVTNDECKIDSISQSWAVISGHGDRERTIRAMNAVDEHLVSRGDGLIKLFEPPFDKSAMDPGYIKGYVPGVRENGGQYTHAAIWAVMAYAGLGDGDRACELFSLLNPINHSSTRAGLHKYKVEPYVMAADIYGMYPHVGRGGWTWYTGSSSLMYRAAIESILGFKLCGNELQIKPCIPKTWPQYEMTYRYQSSTYKITVMNVKAATNPKTEIKLDGTPIEGENIPLVDDGQNHVVSIQL